MSVAYDNNGAAARRGYVAPTPARAAKAQRRRTAWYLRRLHIRLCWGGGKTLVLTRREACERAGAAVIVGLATWAGLATSAWRSHAGGGKLWP